MNPLIKQYLVCCCFCALTACQAPQPIVQGDGQVVTRENAYIKQLSADESRLRSAVTWNKQVIPGTLRVGIASITPQGNNNPFLTKDRPFIITAIKRMLSRTGVLTLDQNWPDFWLDIDIQSYKYFFSSETTEASLKEKILAALPFGSSLLRSTYVAINYRVRENITHHIIMDKTIGTRLDNCTVAGTTYNELESLNNTSAYLGTMIGLTLVANINQSIAEFFFKLNGQQYISEIVAIDRNQLEFLNHHARLTVDDQLMVLFPRNNRPFVYPSAATLGRVKVTGFNGKRVRAIPITFSPKAVQVGDKLLMIKTTPRSLFQSNARESLCIR